MANINSLMSNTSANATNLYGTRNVLSGLASGMDTESMIANSVSGYKAKITQLQQQQTKYEWKQDAYRSITDKLYSLSDKYTSYTSKTNLYSNAFFNNSVATSVVGAPENVGKVSATGKASGDIEILAAQTATAARYSVNASAIYGAAQNTGTAVGNLNAAALNGQELNVTFNGVTKAVKIDASGLAKDANGNVTGESLRDHLQAQINRAFGENRVSVSFADNKLSFSTAESFSTLKVAGASDDVASALGLGGGLTNYLDTSKSIKSLLGDGWTDNFADVRDKADGLTAEKDSEGKVNGYFKDASGNRYKYNSDDQKYYMVDGGGDYMHKLVINGTSINVSENASLSAVMNAVNNSEAGVNIAYSQLTNQFVANAKETGEANGISFDNALAKKLFGVEDPAQRNLKELFRIGDSVTSFTLEINSKVVGPAGTTFNANSTVQDLIDAINDKTGGNRITSSVSYDSATGTFQFPSGWNTRSFTAKDASGNALGTATGAELFRDNLAMADVSRSDGEDATVVANVNGKQITLKRASNTFDMDGLSVCIKDSFGNVSAPDSNDAVSFKTSADADGIMKTIKEFVDDYNAVLKEVHDAYATQPAEKNSSTHAKYEPLTDDDKSSMSESAVKSYEEKAKQGLLFGDSDLSALYGRLVNSVAVGAGAADLKAIGISTTYSGGLTQLKINETELRAALENEPDKVRETFAKSKEGGAPYDGLMTNVKKTLEQYASTSSASPGILVKKAGSTFSSASLLNNAVQKQLENVQAQIERWQTKMSSKIDYYTRQFTALEKLMNTMNSQSSALAGLMGGY
ncbi:MAG: flagellar filament capping protein FliD [Oscillibacter sp.]|nr:flagellar filament capping protein FliD [Oscillibacter sp.]